jgi:hypothetical protein
MSIGQRHVKNGQVLDVKKSKMKTKEEILNEMISEMPWNFNENITPYVLEAMGICAKEQSNALLNELKLKLIGQNCFAQDNFKPEAAQAVESVVKSIMNWIKEKEFK